MELAQQGYQKLLDKYCRAGFKGEPVAFGSESTHDPAREVVTSVDVQGKTAVVKTRNDADGFVSEYEFQLIHENGRWYLLQVYYLDGAEKFESL
jgi:hypothetical protein